MPHADTGPSGLFGRKKLRRAAVLHGFFCPIACIRNWLNERDLREQVGIIHEERDRHGDKDNGYPKPTIQRLLLRSWLCKVALSCGVYRLKRFRAKPGPIFTS